MAGVVEVGFDFVGDVFAEAEGLEVVDVFGVDDDTDFTAGLDGVGFIDAFEGGGGVFKFGEAFNVGVEGFFAGAGAGTADGVGGLDDDVFDCFEGDVFMMGGDSVDDAFVNFEFFEDFLADGGVAAFDFVVDGFADVVEEAGFAGDVYVGTEFGGEGGGEEGDFDGVFEDVLAVGGAEAQPAHEFNEVWVEAGDAGLVDGFFTEFFDDGVDFFLGFF